MILLKNNHTTEDPRLDRIPSTDERNAAYPLRAALEPTVALRKKTWAITWHLDQGSEGACVGFGTTHMINCEPTRHWYRAVTAQKVYEDARKVDEWPGEDYEGTSVLAGLKVWQARGKIAAYRWANSVDDILAFLSSKGAVVMGSYWKSGMWEPDATGTIHVTGRNVGGHCWAARGIDPARERVRCTNSWGSGWGPLGGDFWLSYTDLGKLLDEDGEAAAATEA